MYGKPGLQHGGELDLENYELSSAQVQAVEFVEQAIGEAGRPDNLSGPEALMELRVSEGYENLPTSPWHPLIPNWFRFPHPLTGPLGGSAWPKRAT